MKKHDLRESKSSVVITQPDFSLVGWMKIWIKCCNVACCYLNREDFTDQFNPSGVGHTSVESLCQYIWTVWRVLGFQLKKRGHISDRYKSEEQRLGDIAYCAVLSLCLSVCFPCLTRSRIFLEIFSLGEEEKEVIFWLLSRINWVFFFIHINESWIVCW